MAYTGGIKEIYSIIQAQHKQDDRVFDRKTGK
jgi:hypothetical protein